MRIEAAMTRLDRRGLPGMPCAGFPGCCTLPVIIYEPAAGSVSVLRDLPVAVRDGTVLGVNVVVPAGGGRFPVLSRRTGFTS